MPPQQCAGHGWRIKTFQRLRVCGTAKRALSRRNPTDYTQETNPMPTKGTPTHTVRIPDDLWTQALTLARSRGENLSDIIRQALTHYIEQRGKK